MSPDQIEIKPGMLDADPRLRQLGTLLKRVERRLRWQEAASLLPVALSAAVAIIAALAVGHRVWGLLDAVTLVVAGLALVLVATVAVGLYTMFRRRDLLTTARRADHALRLDERLATAIEDVSRPPQRASPSLLSLRDAQLDDALRSVDGANPEQQIPVTVTRRKLLVPAGLAVLLIVVVFVPNFLVTPGDSAAQAQVAAEQKNIDVLKQAIESQPNSSQDPALQKLLQELSSLSQDLQQGNLTKEEAVARLSQTETDLQKALDPNAAAKREALDQLSRQLASSGNQNARQAGEALMNGDTQKAVDALQKAANNASNMTPDERKALADSLQQARDSTAALDPSLASRLNDAADALQNSDPNVTKQALDNLANQVQDTGQQVATQQQMEQALAQIQQSKANIAQSGQPTPVAGVGTAVAEDTPSSGTAVAQGTALFATPFSGTPLVIAQGSPLSSVPNPTGTITRVVVSGTLSATGTPILVKGTPGIGTPVVAQGQGQGQGQGQAPAPGQGQGQGQTQGQGQRQTGNGGQNGAPVGGWGTGHQEQVYAPPSSVSTNLTPVTVQGQDNPNGEQSSAPVNSDANGTGSALVPYDKIYGQYQQQAGSALNGDYIPQGYKDLVKAYFTNIAP